MNLNNLAASLMYDNINVKGLARISLEGKSCDFTSEFVPILPLNSQVTIITKINSAPYLKITGPVFLSSKRLMRIQPITLALFEDAENYFDIPVSINAQKIKKHFFASDTFDDCKIINCSAEYFTITGGLMPDHGDHNITLLVDGPVFPDTAQIELEYSHEGFLFGRKNSGERSAKYIYRIIEMDEYHRKILLHYIRSQGIGILTKAMTP